MRQAPPLTHLPRFPVVGGVALLAVGVSLAYWSGQVDVSPLMEDHHVREGQVWRLVTSALPHADPIHLLFNLFWVWVLGTLVEEVFGHARTFLLFLLLAAGSSAAEHAFLHGGIGLSGVGYGLFGFSWVLARRDDRFRDAVDARTVGLFVGWFFLCIVTTVAGVWDVANLAHGVGAVLGALTGLAVAGGTPRPVYGAALALLVAGLGAAEYARPYVNFTEERAYERARLGYQALEADRDEAAVRHFRAALAAERGKQDPTSWFNLGIAYQRLENFRAAKDAYQHAAELDPQEPDYAAALEKMQSTLDLEQGGPATDKLPDDVDPAATRPAEPGDGGESEVGARTPDEAR